MNYCITVRDKMHKVTTIAVKQGTTLFSALNDANISFVSNCGRNGHCNACTVYDIQNQCYIKACKTSIQSDMEILLPFSCRNEVSQAICLPLDKVSNQYAFAVDIGTTSMDFSLIDDRTMEVLMNKSILNPHVFYGADVINRIKYASKPENLHMLKASLWDSMIVTMKDMLGMVSRDISSVTKISIAGNTTMIHICMGYDVTSLGRYPFTSNHLEALSLPVSEMIKQSPFSEDCRLNTYPGVSAFVGGDIISGACALDLGQKKTYDFLIDFGTNGELLLLNKEHGFCGATACGPAFDGYLTQQGYGTNMVNHMSLLKTRGIIDTDGLLTPRYHEHGYTFHNGAVVTMNDIQVIQQAKAAIRSGIDILLEKANIHFSDCNIYLAGNFAKHLDIESAIDIGLLPSTSLDRVNVVGNTSLMGAQMLLYNEKACMDRSSAIIERTENMEFASYETFQEYFIDNLKI